MNLSIANPSTKGLGDIEDMIKEIWNVLYDEFRGHIPGYEIVWYMPENVLSLTRIKGGDVDLFFSSTIDGSNSFSLIQGNNSYYFNSTYSGFSAKGEDLKECKEILCEWIDDTRLTKSFINVKKC
jgi:hypothetical protein